MSNFKTREMILVSCNMVDWELREFIVKDGKWFVCSKVGDEGLEVEDQNLQAWKYAKSSWIPKKGEEVNCFDHRHLGVREKGKFLCEGFDGGYICMSNKDREYYYWKYVERLNNET